MGRLVRDPDVVLHPSKLTRLSNKEGWEYGAYMVLHPSKLTRLSNGPTVVAQDSMFYTLLN